MAYSNVPYLHRLVEMYPKRRIVEPHIPVDVDVRMGSISGAEVFLSSNLAKFELST